MEQLTFLQQVHIMWGQSDLAWELHVSWEAVAPISWQLVKADNPNFANDKPADRRACISGWRCLFPSSKLWVDACRTQWWSEGGEEVVIKSGGHLDARKGQGRKLCPRTHVQDTCGTFWTQAKGDVWHCVMTTYSKTTNLKRPFQ